MSYDIERTASGDFLLPQENIPILQKLGSQFQRAGDLLAGVETMTAASLYALVTVLHNKVDGMHQAAEAFLDAASIVINDEDENPSVTADRLDEITTDLIRMYGSMLAGGGNDDFDS